MEILRDAGSIPAASTHAGVPTRLKPKQARQYPLASLSFFSTYRVILALWRLLDRDRRRTHPTPNQHQKGSNGPKGSKSRDTPPSRPVTSNIAKKRAKRVGQKMRFYLPTPVDSRVATRVSSP
ncbi:MAG: hypothetical protein VX876_01855 [Planctomycetota bacterium]|nr:hypothetical protein [Planctomycetota bacterium]